MRKFITLIFILVSVKSFGQNRLLNYVPQYDSVKMRKLLMTSIQTGSSGDSVLVKKANGGVFKVAQSSIGGGTGTVTSFSKTDNYGIVSSVTNPTTTPNHTIGVDTTIGTGIMTKPNLYPLSDVRYIKVSGETRAIQTSNNITSSSGALVGNLYVSTANNTTLVLQNRSFTSATFGVNSATGGVNISSGSYKAFGINPTISESGTAGYQALFISPFESTTGSGTKLLIDAGTNSAASGGGTHMSKFTVDNIGAITSASLTASQAVFTDANKKLVSFNLFGTANTWGPIQLFNAGIGIGTAGGVARSIAFNMPDSHTLNLYPQDAASSNSQVIIPSSTLPSDTLALRSDFGNAVDNILPKTASYTILSTDWVLGKTNVLRVMVDATSAAVTITFPSASGLRGKVIYVTKKDASANTVTNSGVLGSNSLIAQLQSLNYVSDGTSWYPQ